MTKRLVVFCDGTWKTGDDQAVSNVHRMWQMLKEEDDRGILQRKFYQPGVGTDPTGGRVRRTLRNARGGAFGWGLDRNILQVYRWLIQEYEPGDELWFFGFSRGAYTVRSTVGLINNCGILRRAYADQAGRAMQLYRARDPDAHPRTPRSREFRSNYAHEIENIRFLGVFDSVGTLGIPSWFGRVADYVNRRHRYHDVSLSNTVTNAYQALAVDERRRSFAPSLWKQKKDKPFKGDMHQLWFVGVHSDVGGGYPERGLSDITLQWMVEHARQKGGGLAFDEGRLEAAVEPNWCGVLHDSRWPPHKIPGIAQIATRYRGIEKDHRQAVHTTAKKRFDDLPAYHPPNLEKAINDKIKILPKDIPEERAGLVQASARPKEPVAATSRKR